MSENLYVSASGALARLRQLEIVANNLANLETAGYKADRAVFHATLESQIQNPEGGAIGGAAGHSFVQTQFVVSDQRVGPVAQTGGALDVAIQGEGFFEVETPGGLRYTRAGSFVVNADHELSTPAGHPVLGESGPIQVGSTPVQIRASGEVVDTRGTVLGRLQIVRFGAPEVLVKEGQSLLLAPPNEVPVPLESVALLEGSVERSNVQAVSELANLVILQRAFDAVMRVLQSDDEATQALIREMSS